MSGASPYSFPSPDWDRIDAWFGSTRSKRHAFLARWIQRLAIVMVCTLVASAGVEQVGAPTLISQVVGYAGAAGINSAILLIALAWLWRLSDEDGDDGPADSTDPDTPPPGGYHRPRRHVHRGPQRRQARGGPRTLSPRTPRRVTTLRAGDAPEGRRRDICDAAYAALISGND